MLLIDDPQIPWEPRVRAARQLGTGDTRPPSTSVVNAIPVLYLNPPLWIGATLPDDWMRSRYHTPHDDMGQPIDFEAVAAYTRFVAAVAELVANAPSPPVWQAGEFFGQPRP